MEQNKINAQKNNKDFWNKFYKKNLAVNRPSNFAVFILKFLKKYKSTIIDIGCGNGRDLLYFKKKKISYLGIDLSKNATSLIKRKLKSKKNKSRSLMMILLNLITKIKLKTNFQFILDLLGILLMRKMRVFF